MNQQNKPKRPNRRPKSINGDHATSGSEGAPSDFTGRYLVLLSDDTTSAHVRSLQQSGLTVASSSDFPESKVDLQQIDQADAVFFDTLAVAVVKAPIEQIQTIQAANAETVTLIEPEHVVYAIETPDFAPYLLGYRDAVNHLIEHTLSENEAIAVDSDIVDPALWDELLMTWGLQATGVDQTRFSGNQVKVAVLDTGFDLTHPDFVGRQIVTASFVSGQSVQDGHGHGTHCIGTACGPKTPTTNPRYGIAYNAIIYAGKVLNNQGSGTDASILAGIEWAVNNQCAVASMSLGANVASNTPYSRIFEVAARRALQAGTLIVAAAGNHDPNLGSAPVSHPANCPSIMAVAALTPQLTVAPFSNTTLNSDGGQVDIAGPGVNVYSSWPMPRRYNTISGTSMATPHIAGIAALFAEAYPGVRGRALADLLLQLSSRLPLPSQNAGIGLAQVPKG